MDRCPCGSDESSPDCPDRPNRPSGIPRPDRNRNVAALPPLRGQVPCPYPRSRIPTRVPPYSGQPLYLPEGGTSEWPGMRANFMQEVRDFQYDPNFFDEDRPLMQNILISGGGSGGMRQLHRNYRPDMAVNQPIAERPSRVRAPSPQVSRSQASRPQASRPQSRSPSPQVPRVQSRQNARAISAGAAIQQARPARPRMPAVQPVRSTGAIPRVPGTAMLVPSSSPPSPSDSRGQRRTCPSAAPRRQASVRQGPPVDPAQLRAIQQAQSLGVARQKLSRPQPYPMGYMEDFDLMEKVAQQEHALGVASQRPPSGTCGVPGADKSFDEFRELEKAYEKVYASTDKVPYTSPEGLREFEQLERETQARTLRRPPGGQSALPRPRGSQGPVLDDAQLRVRQQARALGVTRPKPCGAMTSRPDESMGEFEMMERLAQQEHEIEARARVPPFDEFEGQGQFEQPERETHLEAVAAPSNLQNLLEMPSVQLDVQPMPEQGPRAPTELRTYIQSQWDRTAAAQNQVQSQMGSSRHEQSQSSRSGQWCPPECHGTK